MGTEKECLKHHEICKKSGQTQTVYCNLKGIGDSQFKKALGRLRETGKSEPAHQKNKG